MYLDRAISGAELLQAIARTNRTAGDSKRFGIVVDYFGVGKNLDDVRARKIDVIVVYKVDRLTRSLADFAKLVELFDGHGVSFR